MTNEITITKKDTPTLRVTVKNSDGAFNISGYTCVLTARTSKTASTNIISVTGSTVVAADGTVDFEFSSTDTDVDENSYYYDVQISNGTNTYTVINSTLTVTGDVT
jgi:hypothetical protein